MRASALVFMLVASLGYACGDVPDPHAASGWLEARWTGADSGRLAAPASAEWCSRGRFLEVRAIQGDTGLALVLYPMDTIEADTYRVVRPEGADSLAPSAAMALRVFGSNAIHGYQGDSGALVLERSSSGELSGVLDARARSVAGRQQLTVTARIRDLVVVPQTRGCVPEAPAHTADSDTGLTGTDVD